MCEKTKWITSSQILSLITACALVSIGALAQQPAQQGAATKSLASPSPSPSPSSNWQRTILETGAEIGALNTKTADGNARTNANDIHLRVNTIIVKNVDNSSPTETAERRYGQIDMTFDIVSSQPNAHIDLHALEATAYHLGFRLINRLFVHRVEFELGRVYLTKVDPNTRYAEEDIALFRYKPEFVPFGDKGLAVGGLFQFDIGFFQMERRDTLDLAQKAMSAAYPTCTTCDLGAPTAGRVDFGKNGERNSRGFSVRVGVSLRYGDAFHFTADTQSYVFHNNDLHTTPAYGTYFYGDIRRNVARADFDLGTVFPKISKGTLKLFAEYEGFSQKLNYGFLTRDGATQTLPEKYLYLYDVKGPSTNRVIFGVRVGMKGFKF
jgi:hypothetical protein